MIILNLPIVTHIICDCGCEFEFDTNDIVALTGCDLDNNITRICSVYCPLCKKEHIVHVIDSKIGDE